MTNHPSKCRGFTLIEILMALAIFSSILVLLLSAFTGAARTREMLADRYGKSRQKAMAVDRFGTDIAGAVSATKLTDSHMSSHEDTFSGQPGATFAFTAFAPASDASERLSSGLVKIRYFPKVSSDAGYLDIYREQSDLAQIENRLPIRETRIARRIKGFRVELFDGSTWQKEWPPAPDKKGALPKIVAIILIGDDGAVMRREVTVTLSGSESQLLFSGNRPKL